MSTQQNDLFGGRSAPKIQHRSTPRDGYAARPGSGPEGETCGSCGFCRFRVVRGRKYFKCGRMSDVWTRDPATDISARSPACERFEAGTPRQTGIR